MSGVSPECAHRTVIGITPPIRRTTTGGRPERGGGHARRARVRRAPRPRPLPTPKNNAAPQRSGPER
eukprot:30888-Prymnesium_polylepis.1